MIGTFLAIIFFLALSFGQFESISLSSGVTVFVHDIILLFLVVTGGLFFVRQKKIILPRLIKPIFGFGAIGIISLSVAIPKFTPFELFSSSLYLWRWIFYAFLYIVVCSSFIDKKIWQWGLYGVGMLMAFVGLIQYVVFPSLRGFMYLGWDVHYGRLFSTLLDPNFMGIFLVLTLVLGMYLVNQSQQKVIILISQLIVALALVLTFSRSAYLALGVAIMVWAIVSKNAKILFVTIGFALAYGLVSRSPLDVNRLDRVVSTQARITNWEQSMQRFSQAPVLGVGFDTLRATATHEKAIDFLGIPSRDAGGVDSSLLLVLITTGSIGGIVYLWLLWSQMNLVIHSSMKLAGLSALAAVVTSSFFNNTLFYSWIMIWIWVFLGIVERSPIKKKK